jgi:hypothetical protein
LCAASPWHGDDHETSEDTVNAVMNAAREKAGKTAL